MSIFLSSVPNPFHLATPSGGWLAPIEAYDPLLRIFPSQTSPVFRLMRVAARSGGLDPKVFGGVEMPMDTRIAVQHKLIAVTTIPSGALGVPPEHVVQWLQDHDITAHGGADKVADQMDLRDARQEQATDEQIRDEGRQRHKAARIGYQYRTGARVSLLRPVVQHVAVPPALSTPVPATTTGSGDPVPAVSSPLE